MIRSIVLLLVSCVTAVAHAQSFQLTPQIIAVAPGSSVPTELTLALLPTINMVGAQIDIAVDLDRFGWFQVLPVQAAGRSRECIVPNKAVRVLVVSTTAIPTDYSIPVCKIRIRAHTQTPPGNYYTTYAGGTAVRLDGSTFGVVANSVRIIVDD